MRNNRIRPASADTTVSAAPSRGGLLSAWTNFWFTAASPFGLHCVRVLAGLLFLGWLLPLAGHQQALFGMDGWFDREAYLEAAELPGGPPVPVGWSLLYLCGSSAVLLDLFYWGSIAVLVLFTLGIWTRLTAVLTWLIVVSFLGSPAARYDADYLLAMLALYLMIGYVFLGQWSRPLTLLGRLLGTNDTVLFGLLRRRKAQTSEPVPSYAANLVMRLLQVHFAIVVVVSGLHKLQFGDWWAGVALWYPMHSPFETTPESLRTDEKTARGFLVALSVAQYAVLAWQIGFPLFAWKKRLRALLLGGAVVGWIGSVFIWKLPIFGPVYLIGCLSYLTAGEWSWVSNLFAPASGQQSGGSRIMPRKEDHVEVGF